MLILRNERLQATVSSYLNGDSPNPAALSITVTQPSLLGLFTQSSLLGHEHEFSACRTLLGTIFPQYLKIPLNECVLNTFSSYEKVLLHNMDEDGATAAEVEVVAEKK